MNTRWALVIGGALIAIPVAIAIGSSAKRRSLGGDDDEVDWAADTEDPYAKPPPEDHGDCLILGKDHPLYSFGAYRVCLSANQKKKLKPKKKLGCGVFACAYDFGRGKVVKFTRNAEDVAALLEAQKLGVVPKVYKTYKLAEEGESLKTGEQKPVYAMIIEKLRAFTPEERRSLDDTLMLVNDIVGQRKINPELTLQQACTGITGQEECGPITSQTILVTEKLRAAGIDWHDIHSGNIGLDKNGKVKVLDLGITGTQLKKAPQILEGALKRLANQRTIKPM